MTETIEVDGLLFPDYFTPLKIPTHYRNDSTGALEAAVSSYLESVLNDTLFTILDLMLVKAYIKYHINAPCWMDNELDEEILELRKLANEINSKEDIQNYISKAMEIAINPL